MMHSIKYNPIGNFSGKNIVHQANIYFKSRKIRQWFSYNWRKINEK